MRRKLTYSLLFFAMLGTAYVFNIFGNLAGWLRYARAGFPDLGDTCDDYPWSQLYFTVENGVVTKLICVGA